MPIEVTRSESLRRSLLAPEKARIHFVRVAALEGVVGKTIDESKARRAGKKRVNTELGSNSGWLDGLLGDTEGERVARRAAEGGIGKETGRGGEPRC